DRDAAGDLLDADRLQAVALGVGQRELLGVVREDADTVDAGIDQEVDGSPLAFLVDGLIGVERRRRDREDAPVDDWLTHADRSPSSSLRYSLRPPCRAPRSGAAGHPRRPLSPT